MLHRRNHHRPNSGAAASSIPVSSGHPTPSRVLPWMRVSKGFPLVPSAALLATGGATPQRFAAFAVAGVKPPVALTVLTGGLTTPGRLTCGPRP